MREGKRIKEEFGFQSEAEAVKEYDALNRDFMYANYPLIADEIILRLGLKGGSILDVGTGPGSLALEFACRLPEAKIYGIDVSVEMLDSAKRNAVQRKINNVQFLCCDAHKIIFSDASFDLVVSFGILHHLQDIRLFFSEIIRVLKEKAPAYIYDLRKDAPEEVVAEIAAGMNPAQRRAFLESVKEALAPSYLEGMLRSLSLSEYALSPLRYSRRTIIKNRDTLKQSRMLGERFNRVLIESFLRK